MTRTGALRLIRDVLIVGAVVAATLTAFGLWLLSADLQAEMDTLEEKS